MSPERLRIATAVGLRIEILLDANAEVVAAPASQSPDDLIEALNAWLGAHELARHARTRLFDTTEHSGALEAARCEALAVLLDPRAGNE